MLSPVDSYKSRVRQAFSRHACTYDLYAGIQVHAANHSAELLAALKIKTAIPDGEILEVGCGTGLFSSKLLSLFPERKIIFSDISSDMLDACRLRLNFRMPVGADCLRPGARNAPLRTMQETSQVATSKAEFRKLDAEELQADQQYAVIASSFAIQWFFQPVEGLSRLLSALKPGGLLVFSVPGNDSCPEWKAAADKLSVPFTRNPMPSILELQNLAIRSKMDFRLQEHFVKETYSDSISMLRSIKALGANTQRHNLQLSCLQLRRLLKELDFNGNPLKASYQVIAGHFRRSRP